MSTLENEPATPAPAERRERRATITDVAELAGVSRAAVSKVFNGTGSISVATTKRIREAAESLDWTPSPAAVALRSAKTKAIGLVIYRGADSDQLNPVSAALIIGIESVLSLHDYGLLLYLIDRDRKGEELFYRRLAAAHRVDGMVLTESTQVDPRFALMKSLGMPAVLLGTPLTQPAVPFIDSSPPGAGISDAVDHLVALGHRRIAYIGGPEERVAALHRRLAFDDAIAAAGVTEARVVLSDYSPKHASVLTAELLSEPEPPTAILYASDEMAIAGMRRVRQSGLSVPQDVSIVGYDGLPLGEWVDPPLTSVRRDAVGRGRAAAWRLLHDLGVADGEPVIPEPMRLIVRASTGPVPVRAQAPTAAAADDVEKKPTA